MSGGVAISVTLLLNRYHGAEWPCSPARLFRALVAGSMNGGNRQFQQDVEPALRWLETQSAPEIDAAKIEKGQSYRISVPNNDMDVAARKWIAGAMEFDAAQLKTLKTVSPWLLSGDGPHITYRWKGAPDEKILSGLRLAVNSLHTLGWGIDMAFADLGMGGAAETTEVKWIPSEKGPALQIPVAGSLDDTHATYERFLRALSGAGVDADTRPSVYGIQRYSPGFGLHLDHIEFALSDLREPRFRSYPAEQTVVIAAWLRHAASEALKEEKYPQEEINELALGHSEFEQNADRLIYLPIPSVGTWHVDGRIRRVIIAMRGREELLAVLKRKLNGWILTSKDGVEMCRLAASSEDKVTRQYLTAREEWTTVTPVILHGHNASHGVISIRKTEKLLGQAFEQAGHSITDVEDWAFQPAPFWSGTPGARSIRVPQHLERWPRYHVWVKFRKKVAGPVLAGIGRHYGVGVFAGMKEQVQ